MGKRYALCQDDQVVESEKTAEHFGIDRKAMMRCVHTAELPKALIQALKSPNELSARRGEALAKVWSRLSDIKQSEVTNFINNWLIPEKQNYNTEQVLELFVSKCGNEKPKKSLGCKISRSEQR
ncbi:hypothetical protein [Vibrio metschnikovii]|uniref:hypothetical protein n=1 Tax=Vibrio metschnikovii TaxID=28172 RepID=UPI003CCB4BC5